MASQSGAERGVPRQGAPGHTALASAQQQHNGAYRPDSGSSETRPVSTSSDADRRLGSVDSQNSSTGGGSGGGGPSTDVSLSSGSTTASNGYGSRAAGAGASASASAGAVGVDSSATQTPATETTTTATSAHGQAVLLGEKPRKTLPALFYDCETTDLIVLISDMIMQLIHHNDRLPLTPSGLTRFHSRAPPAITVQDYISRIVRYTSLEKVCLLSTVVYIDRLCAAFRTFVVSSLTIHRFLITATTVATKGLCDAFCTNTHYAKVGGISLSELNVLELELLAKLNWRILSPEEELQTYYVNMCVNNPKYAIPPEVAASVAGVVDHEPEVVVAMHCPRLETAAAGSDSGDAASSVRDSGHGNGNGIASGDGNQNGNGASAIEARKRRGSTDRPGDPRRRRSHTQLQSQSQSQSHSQSQSQSQVLAQPLAGEHGAVQHQHQHQHQHQNSQQHQHQHQQHQQQRVEVEDTAMREDYSDSSISDDDDAELIDDGETPYRGGSGGQRHATPGQAYGQTSDRGVVDAIDRQVQPALPHR